MAAITTEVQIANLALGLVGQRQFIGSFTDATTEAEVAALYYEQVRDEMLQKWAWRFATKRVVLALTGETRTGWGYCYEAPADMLAPLTIYNGKREPGSGKRVAYTTELNDAGTARLILTDMQDAELFYTVRLATVALWSPLFKSAMAAALAVPFAAALPVKPELIPVLERRAAVALSVAAARDANEAERDPPEDSEFIRER